MFRLVILLTTYTGLALGASLLRAPAPELGGRIVGGQDANIADYPWTVAVLEFNATSCGGVIISDTWVLTAAHCVANFPVYAYSIRAGSSARNSGGQVIPASRIISHPQYSIAAAVTDYDIAAIELTSPITVNNASPIGIAAAGSGPPAGATATITGWGLLHERGDVSPILQVVEVPVVSQESCQLAYRIITERMFCAGEIAGGKDACSQDSGGPLVVDGVVTGLVSFGAGCARPNFPGVYTNLPALRSWITANTGI